MSKLRQFGLLLGLVTLSLQSVSQQSAVPSAPRLEIEVSYATSGQVCRLRFVPCDDLLFSLRTARSPRRHNSRATPDVVERLITSEERGNPIPEKSTANIGNCTDWSHEEYEKVIVDTNANACFPEHNHITVTWKGMDCPSEALSPLDFCGKRATQYREELSALAKRVDSFAARLERDAAQQTDKGAKNRLLHYAIDLKSEIPRYLID